MAGRRKADLAYNAGEFADVPEATTILGAAKVTGRTGNGLTIGLLNAVTNREEARVRPESGSDMNQIVEPLTNYFVGRVKKDMMRGNLVIGGIATSVLRDMDDTFAPRLDEARRVHRHRRPLHVEGAQLFVDREFRHHEHRGRSGGDLGAAAGAARYFQRRTGSRV